MHIIDTQMIINGGGLAGLATALAAAHVGIPCVVIEPVAAAVQLGEAFDGRTVALAYTAQQMFYRLGVWDALQGDAGAIRDIRIVDGRSPLWLHYDHKEVGNAPMGYIVENRHLRAALLQQVMARPEITMLCPASFQNYEADEGGVTVTLKDNRKIRGAVLVAADGKYSPVRAAAGIEARHTEYGQTAIVCTVRHEKHHQGVAIERFLPAGPFAILPMGKIEGGEEGHYSSLVWTEKRELVPHFLAMDGALFLAQLRKRFGEYLGGLEVVGKRWSYPVSLTRAKCITAPRVALVGDAAQAIHPIAGQGYNLGLRDIAALADCLAEAKHAGQDIGGEGALKHYAALRQVDSAMMVVATDSLNKLFSNDIIPVKLSRNLGLAAVGKLPPLKRHFMRHAMGLRRNPSSLMEEIS